MRLPLLLLLVLSTTLPAAVEQLTLADGRVFVGEYDDATAQLHTTIAGKPFSLAVAKDQIADREVYRPAKAAKQAAAAAAAAQASGTPPAAVVAAPKALTPEGKLAAERDAAWGRKVREADQLAADAGKARRDAASARADAERQLATSKAHWRAFRKRALAEGVTLPEEPEKDPTLVILPHTFGNDQAVLDAKALSKKAVANAEALDALAERLQAQSAAARTEAGMMPHSDR